MMLSRETSPGARAARAETLQSEVAERHARLLSNSLYPDKALQERSFAGVYFLAKHGRELLAQLLDTIQPDCLDHQLITLSSPLALSFRAKQIIPKANPSSTPRDPLFLAPPPGLLAYA